MSDDDIEFLDEDAEIVQKCVLAVQSQPAIKIEPAEEDEEPPAHIIQKPKVDLTPLLVERPNFTTDKPASTKKRKKVEDDTDYDPIVDSPYFNRRRRYAPRGSNARKHETAGRSGQQSSSSQQSPPVRKAALPRAQINRREMTIRIPDFDDPLCLPVRALVKDENDARRLKHWNQLCLEQFKKNDTPLRPRDGPVCSSKRTVVIRNLFNKYTGKTETTYWNKITVEGKAGDAKSEVAQAVLPRYREKKILTAYRLEETKRRRTFRDSCEVILSKEMQEEEETLVAYKPETSLSMVFKMFRSKAPDAPEEDKRYLQEVASCTACARCYQASWRGVDEAAGEQRAASCPLCARACGSARSLLAHVRTHAPELVRQHRKPLAQLLAELAPHQYRCRACGLRAGAVRALRRHLAAHAGGAEFYCEVGDHTVS